MNDLAILFSDAATSRIEEVASCLGSSESTVTVEQLVQRAPAARRYISP